MQLKGNRMPLYDYKCSVCLHRYERQLKIADLDQPQTCRNCGNVMNRQISAPMVKGDLPGYDCPITGKWIEGRKAHEENLKRHGCRVYEAGETQAFEARRKREEEDFDKRVDETADQVLDSWPAEKKERLAQEIASGADAQLTRSTPTF